MNAIAYVIAVLNPLLLNSRYVSMHMGPLHSLSNDISKLPNLPQDAFKVSTYHRNENKGIYISNNLRDYIYYGQGDRDEEGFILTLDFQSSKLDPPNKPESLGFLLHPKDFTEEDKRRVDQYIQTLHKERRHPRSIHKF